MGDYRSDLKFGRIGLVEAEGLLQRIEPDSTVGRANAEDPHEFIWHTASGERRVLVRIERRFTGNLFLELCANESAQSPGWFATSEADILLYGFGEYKPGERRVWYLIDMPMLRRIASLELALEKTDVTPSELRSVLAELFRPMPAYKWARTTVKGKFRYKTIGLLLAIDKIEAKGAIISKFEVG